MWAISMLRLWQANNFTRGPILLVEASSRRLCGEWDCAQVWLLGGGKKERNSLFTVGSPVSRLLEGLIELKLMWRTTLIDLIFLII